jgi:hypothetical protein
MSLHGGRGLEKIAPGCVVGHDLNAPNGLLSPVFPYKQLGQGQSTLRRRAQETSSVFLDLESAQKLAC